MARRPASFDLGGTVESGGVFPFATSWLVQANGQGQAGRRLLDQGVPTCVGAEGLATLS